MNINTWGKPLWKTTGTAKGWISKEKGKASTQSVVLDSAGGRVSEGIDLPFKPRPRLKRNQTSI